MQQMQGNKNMSMKNREDDPLYDKEIQKILNKLISEETIANCFYIGCIAAACKCQKTVFSDMFVEIATDENGKALIFQQYNILGDLKRE